jgi:hypothetical protein
MDEAIKNLREEVAFALGNILPDRCSIIDQEVDRVFRACSPAYLLHQGFLKLVAEFYVEACCPGLGGTARFWETRNVVLECLCAVFEDGSKASSVDSARWKRLAQDISASIHNKLI